MHIVIIILFISLAPGVARADDSLLTTLSKSNDGTWRVHYESSEPISRIEFQRGPSQSTHQSPNQSRAARWQVNEAFQIYVEGEREYLKRVDNAAFTSVLAELTPTYIALDKDYAPFSPFSDGGMLIHSGRFFACPEQCTDADTHWSMAIQLPADEDVIVNGQRYQGSASWQDSDSGQKLYVGAAEPQDDGNFISVIDPGLPESLRNLMAVNLPKFMAFFAERLDQPQTKPQLFASYSTTDDGRYGHQGGVLPNQVFMHWYGFVDESLAEPVLWFFAHEAAHLYQKQAFSNQPAEAWLHEGSAELFAGLAMEQLGQGQGMLSDSLNRARAECSEGMGEGTSFHQAVAMNSRLHYSCGLTLFAAMHQDLQSQHQSIFALWQAYSNAIDSGQLASESVFLEVAEDYLSPTAFERLTDFLSGASSPTAYMW